MKLGTAAQIWDASSMWKGATSEIEMSEGRWLHIFENRAKLKLGKKHGEDSAFRREVRWCLLANYTPFLKHLEWLNSPRSSEALLTQPTVDDFMKARDLIRYDPEWEVSYKMDPFNGASWTFSVVDQPPVLSIRFYNGFPGIEGLTNHFIRSDWYDAFVDLSAPLDDLDLALGQAKKWWHEKTGKPRPKPGRPKKEDIGFCDKPLSPIVKKERVGNGSVFHIQIRIGVEAKRLEDALRGLVKSERHSGRKPRFTPDLDNLDILRDYCARNEPPKKASKKTKSRPLVQWSSNEKIRTNIGQLLAFVDPNNMREYPDHPRKPSKKRPYYKGQVPPSRYFGTE